MSNELRKHLANHRKPVGEFQREDRYIVIKRSDLKKVPASYRSHLVDPMLSLLAHLPNRECLVIESDWPEYEPAWAAIEARMAGAAPQPPASAARQFDYDRGFAAGEAERQTLQAENRRLRQFETALSEWADKTEWLRKSVEPKELGMHLADVMKARIERNQYKAELYDEVWELATGLGYMNVTTAIGELRKERDQLLALLKDCRWRIVNKDVSTDDYKRLDKPVVDRIDAIRSKPADSEPDVEPPEATGDCHDDDLGDGEAERMQRKAKNESTAYDDFDNGVD